MTQVHRPHIVAGHGICHLGTSPVLDFDEEFGLELEGGEISENARNHPQLALRADYVVDPDLYFYALAGKAGVTCVVPFLENLLRLPPSLPLSVILGSVSVCAQTRTLTIWALPVVTGFIELEVDFCFGHNDLGLYATSNSGVSREVFWCGLTLPITGLRQSAKRAVAIPVDWRVRPLSARQGFER